MNVVLLRILQTILGGDLVIVTAWVLLIAFGLVVLGEWDTEGDKKLTIWVGVAKFISMIIVSVAAGVIWGGLFQ